MKSKPTSQNLVKKILAKDLISSAILSMLTILARPSPAAIELVDYLKLDHDVSTEILRAGNHDESGENDYYFKVDAYALLISKEEVEKGFEKRKKIPMALGEYGDYKIKPLNFWRKTKDSNLSVTIKGDQIRSMVSGAMRQFEVVESKIAVIVVVTMMEREKQFGFYGDDQIIGKAEYYPIPETLPRAPSTEDLTLEISDDKGASVVISVRYHVNRKLTISP